MIQRIVVKSRVQSDGSLHLSIPNGLAEAGREVQVTVEAIPNLETSQQEWSAWVAAMAGSWQGDFERPPQMEFEDREFLS